MSKTLQEKQEAQRRLRQVVDVVCKCGGTLYYLCTETATRQKEVYTDQCDKCGKKFKVTYEPTKIEAI